MRFLDGLSESQRGAVAEWAAETLALLLTGGDLRLMRPVPDDTLVDRVAVRPGSASGSLLQIKTRVATVDGRYLQFRVTAARRDEAPGRLHILCTHLTDRSPWLDGVIALVPLERLGRPAASGYWSFTLPLDPKARSKWRPYIHPVTGLGTAISRATGEGRDYPFPPVGGAHALVGRLSSLARGFIIEKEAEILLTVYSRGRLHVWPSAVDDFGQDFVLTEESRPEALRVQPKGAFSRRADGAIAIRVHRSTFRPRPFNLLMFLLYRPELPGVHPYGFVMRADEFERRATRTERHLVFAGRPDPASRDKFHDWLYRVEEMPAVFQTALATLRAEGPAAVVPTKRSAVLAARRRTGLPRSVRVTASARR